MRAFHYTLNNCALFWGAFGNSYFTTKKIVAVGECLCDQQSGIHLLNCMTSLVKSSLWCAVIVTVISNGVTSVVLLRSLPPPSPQTSPQKCTHRRAFRFSFGPLENWTSSTNHQFLNKSIHLDWQRIRSYVFSKPTKLKINLSRGPSSLIPLH